MAKRNIPLQGKGRRFRADLWLDEKITGRTLHVLRQQGVRFPENANPRKTADGLSAFAGAHYRSEAVRTAWILVEGGNALHFLRLFT